MTKVVCAMSGGIDSSVAAALLRGAGYDVIGVFMRLADLPTFKKGEKRAKKVAKILKIPLLVLDLRKEFKKRIVDYFLDGYKKGITPNPCVVCNKEIKFGLLLERALKLDADFVATGHYARKKKFENRKQKTEYKLLKAKDKNKDQSYFLWKLSQRQLKHILFPVGNYTRKEVEKMAKKFRLPFGSVKKSMEICFVPTRIDYFLKKYLKPKPGIITTKDGKKIGEHEGLPFYTIGQRKGIKLPGGPFYVLDKNLKKNQLFVSKDENDLYKKELFVKNVNWIRAPSGRSVLDRAQKICALVSGKEPKLPLQVKAKIRYRSKSVPATITRSLKSKVYSLKFGRPQRAITPGQSVVMYKGEVLLGGGIIC
jgi:tRNA-specific 2-thiouridylase